jgi:hypothetical protein
VLLPERQAEQIVLGEQPAEVPWILRFGVDLGGARRDPLGDHLADRVAELDLLLAQRVGVRRRCGRGHARSLVRVCFRTARETMAPWA